jgi:hypothetical protein
MLFPAYAYTSLGFGLVFIYPHLTVSEKYDKDQNLHLPTHCWHSQFFMEFKISVLSLFMQFRKRYTLMVRKSKAQIIMQFKLQITAFYLYLCSHSSSE